MNKKTDRGTHDVMVRPANDIYQKLAFIAAIEKRNHGPQALKFVEEGISRYLSDHPDIAKQLQDQT